jgi:PAS domain S-box-containing protein
MPQTSVQGHDIVATEQLAVPEPIVAEWTQTIAPAEVAPHGDDEMLSHLRDINHRLVHATQCLRELADQAEEARARAALSELRFRSLVNTVAAIVWSADADGRVRFDAAQWRVLTGLEIAEPAGEWDWLEGVHVDDRERVRTTWSKSVASRSIYQCEHRLRLRGGGTAWVHARAVPISGDDVPVREWMGMMADITDRKVVEEARERFIAVLGHDLRTPLAAIDLSAEHLASADAFKQPEERLRIAKLIGRCSGRMKRMIADVLDFTRGRLGGGIPLSLTPTDFGQVCRDAVTELLAVHSSRKIVVETSGDLVGVWDAGRVEQVVSNLIGNALEHGADPVRVTIRGQGDELVLEINNQNLGPPVPAELLPLLFEPFRRGAPDDHHSTGLGLGLYIASEIVRAHGGTIEATSSLAEGTTFRSRWPRDLPRQLGVTLVSRPRPID